MSHALRLRTKNESNREDGPIASAGGFHGEANDIVAEKPKPVAMPEHQEPSVANNKSGHPSTERQGDSGPSAISSTGSRTVYSQLPLFLHNEAARLLPPASAASSAITTSAGASLLLAQESQFDPNLQAYWNILCQQAATRHSDLH